MERLAHRLLNSGGVCHPPVPSELFSLADEEHPIEVQFLPLKACHGALWHLNGIWIILLRNDDTPATKRFTLFHEAFHILAHRKSTPVFSKRGTAEGTFNELLANYFAACMLMPARWVTEKWEEANDLKQMAKIFQVSKPEMCIRLKCLGFF
ncbi:hypothetical protein ES703_115416 [subsurface metagenome]